jgi:quercetin dioxygenase-like cupin family protein
MSRFAIRNLMEIEDVFDGPEIEARFARKGLDSEHLGISHFRYAPGFTAVDGHRHKEQEEAYVVLGGSGRIRLDDKVAELRRWDVVRVSPEVVRGFEAGPDGLEILAVGSDRPESGDGVRAPDRWPRQDV